jgi:hypothetical protein
VSGGLAGGLPAASRELPVVVGVHHEVVVFACVEGHVDIVKPYES